MAPIAGLQTARAQAAQFFSHPTWDVILLLLIACAGLFFVFSRARRRIVSSLVHTYIASSLTAIIPKERIADFIGVEHAARIEAGIFLAIFFILFIFLGSLGSGILRTWWYAIILSVLQMGLFLHILFGFLSRAEQNALAPFTKTFIANPDLAFWWYLLPVVALLVIRRLTLRYE